MKRINFISCFVLLAIIAHSAVKSSIWTSENVPCCIKHCCGVYEQNSIVNSVDVHVDDWTAKWAIIAGNEIFRSHPSWVLRAKPHETSIATFFCYSYTQTDGCCFLMPASKQHNDTNQMLSVWFFFVYLSMFLHNLCIKVILMKECSSFLISRYRQSQSYF